MKYQKPVAVSLNHQARSVKGDVPLGCVSGGNTGLTSATCGVGGIAYGGCAPGSDPGTLVSCAGGNDAFGGDCLSGVVVSSAFYCESGAGGGNDPYGCTAGPSFS